MILSAEGKTEKGLSRKNNEDNLCLDPVTGLFAVADGVGGAASGEVASRVAMEVLRDHIRKTANGDSTEGRDRTEGLARIKEGIRLANKAVWDASKSDPALRGMGTTVAAVIIEGSRMGVAHAGDSRVYLIRSGVMTQLTEDHSLVAEQVKAGLISKEDAEVSSMRNVITRALGQEGEVDIDTSEMALMEGDRIVLCTDGLTTMVTERSILSTVLSHDSPGDGCSALVDLANRGGGRDNITVVLIYIKEDSPFDIVRRFFRMNRR